MTEERTRWVGAIINGEFELRQYLGGSDSTAVFLTNRGDRKLQVAAIKLISADGATAERQLSRWNLAAKLSSPHLLRIFESGRCRLDHSDFLYVVMEYAEENLAQIVPVRPLAPNEAREMLIPTLDALAYLHAKGFVHGRIKPANIMATNDQLKLSIDGLASMRDNELLRTPTVYDPPEAANGKLSPAGDVWSLGMTLVEVLTQRLPVVEGNQQPAPIVPDTFPAPFVEIVRLCLRHDPQSRSTVAEIAAHLNPFASTKEPTRLTPQAVTVSAAPQLPGTRPAAAPPQPGLGHLKRTPSPPRPPMASNATSTTYARRPKGTAKSRYFIPAVAAVLVLSAILGGARLLNRREAQRVSQSFETSPAASPSAASSSPRTSKDQPSSAQPVPKSVEQSYDAQSNAHRRPMPSQTEQPAAQSKSQRPPNRDASRPAGVDAVVKTSAKGSLLGEVLQQDVPEVSSKARSSIQGKVRVNIKVHVDSSGNVTEAEFASRGPSKYFADLALKSAHRWEFAPAKANGQYVPSEWVLHYEFGSAGTKVRPQQTAP